MVLLGKVVMSTMVEYDLSAERFQILDDELNLHDAEVVIDDCMLVVDYDGISTFEFTAYFMLTGTWYTVEGEWMASGHHVAVWAPHGLQVLDLTAQGWGSEPSSYTAAGRAERVAEALGEAVCVLVPHTVTVVRWVPSPPEALTPPLF